MKGGYTSFKKLGKKAVKGEDIRIGWNDVIGMDEAKQEAKEIVRLVTERAHLQRIGGKILKGILMMGPPGCGKTYLAKAIATESNLPFISLSGSEFVEIFAGIGASRVRKLFKQAQNLAYVEGGCIIFIDELDAVGSKRGTDFGGGAVNETNSTLNQLLVEMDGLKEEDHNILIIGATNAEENVLDQALLRPGRFDRKIYVQLPSLEERVKLVQYYLKNVKYDSSVDIKRLARLTVGNSPADIAHLVREATLIAVRNKNELISSKEISEAYDRVELGVKHKIVFNEKERKMIAFHEAGHVVITYLLVPTKDVFKASIIPRKNFGGSTWMIKKEESFIPDKEDLLGEIKILLSGYCAEKIKFGLTSTGVGDDLSRANELAEKMVSLWGMGTSGATSVTNSSFAYTSRQVAEGDKDDIITNCLNEVHELLRKEIPILDKIAGELLEKDELDYDTIEAIFKSAGKSRMIEKKERIAAKKLSWDDVIGMDEAKQEASEVVKLIKDRAQLQQVGGRIIRGLLMFGPPGCGKTYLASAMASEAELPFLSKSGSEFVEMYVGVGASRIRHLFREARELALAKGGCIIFIDEIDALGGKRGNRADSAEREYNQTTNQLLAEMDGLKEKDEQYNIIVIGATNMGEDFMDAALLRPGRFDRKLYVDLPGMEDRQKLFDYYFTKVKYNPDEINSLRLARVTAGWSPADIANLTREAAFITIRNKKDLIGLKELDEARERIELGLKRKIKQTDKEKKAIAYHESGHAIMTHCVSPDRETFKLSIIPRKETGGVSWSPEKDEGLLRDKIQLLSRIMVSLGGFVAEKIKCRATSTGPDADFANALTVAHNMVWRWGMGKTGLIGNFGSLQKDSMSEETKAKLDSDVQQILQECLKETEAKLLEEDKLLEALSQKLLEKEELNYDEMEAIFKEFGKTLPPII
ncbi:MAG: AAA family ATPase [Candidatus Omnitrophica bacterium]|nr:AAA family ATPase [Candidatus Omnitrophota bacterium]